VVVVVVRLLSMFVCSYGGYRIAALLNENYILRNPQQALAIIVSIILGLLIGYVLGGVLGRYSASALGGLDTLVFKASGADIFLIIMGALAGLLIALLPSVALLHFAWPGYVISLILFLFGGFIGGRMSYIKRSELAAMFKLGGVSGHAVPGSNARILDTSVIIDGRVVDIAKAGFLDGTMVVPRFVLEELQSVADSADNLKRSRGRRGLDVLNSLQRLDNVRIEITDQDFPEVTGVDSKLTTLSKVTGMPMVTNDFNLNRVAELQGVQILNINELAGALRPVVLPGEEMQVKIIREGKESGQGVGYLDDGTMIVVEHGKKAIGSESTVVATSVLQTPAGKMIFTELKEDAQER